MLIENNEILIFFRNHASYARAAAHGGFEKVIADYVKLLLVISSGI